MTTAEYCQRQEKKLNNIRGLVFTAALRLRNLRYMTDRGVGLYIASQTVETNIDDHPGPPGRTRSRPWAIRTAWAAMRRRAGRRGMKFKDRGGFYRAQTSGAIRAICAGAGKWKRKRKATKASKGRVSLPESNGRKPENRSNRQGDRWKSAGPAASAQHGRPANEKAQHQAGGLPRLRLGYRFRGQLCERT